MSPGKLDPQLLEKKILTLESWISQTQALSTKPWKTEIAYRWSIERGLFLCAQLAIDISVQVATAKGRPVDDYTDAIDALAELTVFDTSFAAKFRPIVGFRNALTHGYMRINEEIVVEALGEGMLQLKAFCGYLRKYMGV